MRSNCKPTKDEIEALLLSLDCLQEKLREAAGATVNVEMRIRLIGQLSEQVRSELKLKCKQQYKNCNLKNLEEAILRVFGGRLTARERKVVEEFRLLRDKLHHCDFVSLMRLLKQEPKCREIMPQSIAKVDVVEDNIWEAIFTIDRNGGFEKIRSKALSVIEILNKILRWLAQIGVREWLHDYIFYLPGGKTEISSKILNGSFRDG